MAKAIVNFCLWQATFFTVSAATACYYPDGSLVADPAYQPCNPAVGAQSMCCGTNHTQPTLDDTCLPNGLCQTRGATADNMYWRESCTDATWNSPSCLKGFCVSGVVSVFALSPVLFVSLEERHRKLTSTHASSGGVWQHRTDPM